MIKKKCIAIIPARISSKRIKKKNIKMFFDRPIISYAIKNAIKSKLFDEVVVSTESIKIKKISEKFGATVPFIRPKKLAGDHVGIVDVIAHAVKKIIKDRKDLFAVCCIFPATPLLNKGDLRDSFKIFKKGKWEYVFCAAKLNSNPERSFKLDKYKNLKVPKGNFTKNKRTQDYKVSYCDLGQFYWARPKTWIKKKRIFSNKSTIYLHPNPMIVDIDTNKDWQKAKSIFIKKNEYILKN